MRNFYVLTLLMLGLNFASFGKDRYIPFAKQRKGIDNVSESISPTREVLQQKSGNIDVSYFFPGAKASDKKENNEVYSFLHIEGLGQTGQIGAPSLPMRNDLYVLTRDQQPQIEIISAEYTEIDGFPIYPVLDYPIDTEGMGDPEFKKDNAVYGKNAFFPSYQAKVVQNQVMRDTRVVRVQICPVQYNPVSHKLRVYSKIEYRLHKTGQRIVTDLNQNTVKVLKNVAINGDAIIPQNNKLRKGADSNAKDYLILTHSMFDEAAKKLASWKSSLGFKVEVISKDKWTTSSVRSAISYRYHHMNPKPKYFVLIGDIEQIPSMKFKNYENADFYSDLYYSCMDGAGDYTPDMARGRISVRNAEQANIVIDKIINYEKNPVEDASFYQKALNCAQYQDDNTDGFADRRFCHTSEDIRNYVMQQGYQVQRIYYCNKDVTPANFNNGRFSKGEAIPEELLKQNGFDWNGGADQIVDAINQGRFYVFHRDHGYAGGIGWAHPEFVTPEIDRLNNGDKLPVVFSINCHTGEFSYKECFAEKFLRKENGGAVAVFGASYASLSGPNDGLSIGMVESIWPEPGVLPSFGTGSGAVNPRPKAFDQPTTRLGDILNLGLLRMTETWAPDNSDLLYTYRLFHLFGDPAMRMWTSQPEVMTATLPEELTVGQKSLDITDATKEGALVTLVQGDQILAKGKVQYGKCHLEFEALPKGKKFQLTLSHVNCHPIFKEYALDIDKVIPTVDIRFDNKIAIQGAPIHFFAVTEGVVDQYLWNFGTENVTYLENTTAASRNPIVQFNEKGVFDVKLVATNKIGDGEKLIASAVTVDEIVDASCVGTITPSPNTYGMGINTFILGGFMNSSKNVNIEPGYVDFTSEGVIPVSNGASYPVSVASSTVNPVQCRLYIDKNGDGTFADNEMIFNKGPFKGTCAESITIDDSFTSDKVLRIRVMTEYADMSITGPCSDIKYGQVEDYCMMVRGYQQTAITGEVSAVGFHNATFNGSLKLLGNPNVTEKGFVYAAEEGVSIKNTKIASTSSDPAKLTASIDGLKEGTMYYVKAYVVADGEVVLGDEVSFSTFGNAPDAHVTNFHTYLTMSKMQPLSWDAAQSTTPVAGYIIKMGTSPEDIANPVDGVVEDNDNAIYVEGGDETGTIIAGLSPNTEYSYKIFPYANGGENIRYYKDGKVPSITSTTLEEGSYLALTSKYKFPLINSLKFVEIANNEARSAGDNDFKALSTKVCPGKQYLINIEGRGLSTLDVWYSVWIDWDQDGFFSSEERTTLGEEAGECTLRKMIPVPSDAKTGKTYMRVVAGISSSRKNTCYGEVLAYQLEDYSIDVDSNFNLYNTWTGAVSTEWTNTENWSKKEVPTAASPVVIDNVDNDPVITSEVQVSSLTINPEAQLTIAEGADVNVVDLLDNKGTLNVTGGRLNISDYLLVDPASHMTIDGGDVTTRKIAKNYDDSVLKGRFDLLDGSLTVNSSFLCANEGFVAKVSEPFVLAIGGNIALNDYSWDGGFKGTLKFVTGFSSRVVTTFAQQNVSLTLDNVVVDAPGQTISLTHKSMELERTVTITNKLDLIAGTLNTTHGDKVVNTISLKNVTLHEGATLDLGITSLYLAGTVDGEGVFSHPDAATRFLTSAEDLVLNIPTEFAGVQKVGKHKVIANKPMYISTRVAVDTIYVNNTNIRIPNFTPSPFGSNITPKFMLDGDCDVTVDFSTYDSSDILDVNCGNRTYNCKLKAPRRVGIKASVKYSFTSSTSEYHQDGNVKIVPDDALLTKKLESTISHKGYDYEAANYHWAIKDGVWKIIPMDDVKASVTSDLSKPVELAFMAQKPAPKVTVDDQAGIAAHLVGATEAMEYHLNNQEWCHCSPDQELYLNGSNSLTVRYEATDSALASLETSDLDNDDKWNADINLSNSSIAENQGAKAKIGDLILVGEEVSPDANTPDAVATLSPGILDNDQFIIEGHTLYAKNSLDYETKSRYTIQVNFDSQDTPIHKYCIQVTDANESPVLNGVVGSDVDENSLGKILLDITDEDLVHGDVLTVSFESGLLDNDQMKIIEEGGKYYAQFKVAPDFEVKHSYSVKATAQDQSGASIDIPFVVNVQDVAELPSAITSSKTEINDNAVAGDVVSTLSIEDIDAVNGAYTVAITNVDGANKDNFELDGLNLKLKGNVVYALGVNPLNVITFSVSEDGVAGVASFDITFTINDINEKPRFVANDGNCHLSENKHADFVVKEFRAVDPEGDAITYHLVDDKNGAFTVKENYLIAKKSVNYEQNKAFDLSVEAVDPDGLKATQDFTVAIDDQNDAPQASMNDIVTKVNPKTSIQLDATASTDEDANDELQYQWSISGVDANITDADKANAILEVPSVDVDTEAVVVLEVSDGTETSMIYKSILITGKSTGINSSIKVQLDKVYPNPCVDHFTITLAEMPKSPVKVSLINSVGSTVWNKTMDSSKETFPVSVPAGMYLVKIVKGDVTSVQKLIVK